MVGSMNDGIDEAIAAAPGEDSVVQFTTIKFMMGNSRRTVPISISLPVDLQEDEAFAIVEAICKITRSLQARKKQQSPIMLPPTRVPRDLKLA